MLNNSKFTFFTFALAYTDAYPYFGKVIVIVNPISGLFNAIIEPFTVSS